jgi:hypothetical protein
MSTTYLPRQAEALHRCLSYRVKIDGGEVERAAVDGYSIALSRQVGTPDAEVAAAVGTRLDWRVYDRELPERLAHQLHVPVAVLEQIDERQRSWLLECIAAFASAPEVSQGRYVRGLISLVRSLGEQGRCVIVGRAAAYILPPVSTLRVRLVGDREDRIARLARQLHVNWEEAAHKLEELGRQRARFIGEHFHAEPDDTRHYELVLNTSHWSPADCAEFIVQALHRKAAGCLVP